MSANYSDSSSEEDNFSTITTAVTLGYATTEETGDQISQLGGLPKWLHENSPLDPRLAKCHNCNRLMTLLCQLNAELPECVGERRLYLWACLQRGCRRKKGSVRAIKGVKVSEADLNKKEQERKSRATPLEGNKKPTGKQEGPIRMGDLLFGGGASNSPTAPNANFNPFSTSSANPFSFSVANDTTSFPPLPSTSTTSSKAQERQRHQQQSPSLSSTFSSVLKISNGGASVPSPLPPSPQPKITPQLFGSPEPWPDPLPGPTFPNFSLDAENETLEKSLPQVPSTIKVSSDMDEDMVGGGSTDNKAEDWGGLSKSVVDKTFQKFADRVDQNPEQVLRYEHKGFPLLYSTTDEVGRFLLSSYASSFPSKSTASSSSQSQSQSVQSFRCPHCDQARKFEFQLMPHAISILEGDDMASIEDGMEWGTIIVYTCTCLPNKENGWIDVNGVGYVEEWVGVQWEQIKK